MIPLAVSLLWLAVGVIILGAVLWILMTVIGHFFPGSVTDNIRYLVAAVFAILILIALLTSLSGGGVGGLHFPYSR
jgi:hypothetical protein